MDKRFLDVLTFVLNEIRENNDGDIDLQTVVDILEDEGFSEDEISSAMSWLMDHGEQLDRVTTQPLRHLAICTVLVIHMRPVQRSYHSPEQVVGACTLLLMVTHEFFLMLLVVALVLLGNIMLVAVKFGMQETMVQGQG